MSKSRHIFRIALAALLGAVTSVLVTWAIIYRGFAPATSPRWFVLDISDLVFKGYALGWQRTEGTFTTSHAFIVVERETFLAHPIYSARLARLRDVPGSCASSIERHGPLMASEYGKSLRFDVLEFGWPWRCLAYEDACMPADLTDNEWNLVNGVWKPVISYDDWPLKPLYYAIEIGGTRYPWRPTLGLLANAAVYGSVWYALIAVISAIRKRRRPNAGSCICGYPLRGLSRQSRCPECGAAFTR